MVFLAPSVCLAVAGPLAGYLGARTRPTTFMAGAIGAGALGLLVLGLDGDWFAFVPAFAVVGLGFGLAWAFTSVGTQAVVKPERAGEASGVTLTIVVAVAGLCVAAGATTIEALQGPGTSEGDAVEELMRAVAIGALAVAVILALIRNRADAPASTVQSSPAT